MKASAPALASAFSTLRRLPLPLSTMAMRGLLMDDF
jgi:hypothetical protein